MTEAPFCNVSVAELPGKPKSPQGMLTVPLNATPDQITNIINQNFSIMSRGNFVEDRSKRVTERVRITDSNGSGAYIDILQVKAISLINPLTGQTLVWKR